MIKRRSRLDLGEFVWTPHSSIEALNCNMADIAQLTSQTIILMVSNILLNVAHTVSQPVESKNDFVRPSICFFPEQLKFPNCNKYPILGPRISVLRTSFHPSVRLTVPPLDSETGLTGDFRSKTYLPLN